MADMQCIYRYPWSGPFWAAGKVVGLLALLVLVYVFVWRTGGIKYSAAHLFYVPIVLSGFLFGTVGGLLAGLAAGALAATLPLDTATMEMQGHVNWVFRIAAFVFVGGLMGVLMQIADANLGRLRELVLHSCSLLGGALRGFSSAVSAKDTYTGGHCERVAHNAYSIASQLGFSAQEKSRVFFAGLLHDVGKIGVPDAILNKPGKLTTQEMLVMQRHCVLGYDIINAVSPSLDFIARAVREHHEHWDGRGYPDRLKGEDIYIYSRILAVADVYEALTTKRSYRDPMPEDQAFCLMLKHKGTHFDPVVMDAFQAARKQKQLQACQGQACWKELPASLDVYLARVVLHDVKHDSPLWREMFRPKHLHLMHSIKARHM
jgi:HD-GYP domain-containing protein (c-di-GMP phosphodiesterase class II)